MNNCTVYPDSIGMLLDPKNTRFINNLTVSVKGSRRQVNLFTFQPGLKESHTYNEYFYKKQAVFNLPFGSLTFCNTTGNQYLNISLGRANNKPNNIITAEEWELPFLFVYIENKLKSYGVYTNLYKAKLTRVDAFKNFETNYDLIDYHPIFRSLAIKWQRKLSDISDSLYFQRNGIDLVIYNKYRELLNKNHLYDEVSRNLNRCELRLRKAAKVRSVLQVDTLADLLRNKHCISTAFDDFVSQNLFKFETPEINYSSILTDADQIEYFRKKYPKSFIGALVEGFFAFHFPWADELLHILKYDRITPRSTYYRLRSRLQERAFDYLISHPITRNGYLYGEMYQELNSQLIDPQNQNIEFKEAA